PLVYYALSALNSSPFIDSIIIAAEKGCVKRFEYLSARFKLDKVNKICVGGKTRFESVRNCLGFVDSSFDVVLIHDGARPLPGADAISGSIRIAWKFGGCVVAVPENDTVKVADKSLFIKKTLDRSVIFRAQTPQAFRRQILQKAYASSAPKIATDDSSIVEMFGGKVKILKGSYNNIKITNKEDLKFAEALL
ncbi:MAG TPA: IspD/TarI family cytidylyltransferase, partial [Candidatus Omnitrophota bacterium]|nr:IspD/TarI family cytidylyltransferase [Candidatus Omnitrophota bacterium]